MKQMSHNRQKGFRKKVLINSKFKQFKLINALPSCVLKCKPKPGLGRKFGLCLSDMLDQTCRIGQKQKKDDSFLTKI